MYCYRDVTAASWPQQVLLHGASPREPLLHCSWAGPAAGAIKNSVCCIAGKAAAEQVSLHRL